MTWTEWNDRIGSKIVDRAFAIIGNKPYSVADVEQAIRQARFELSAECGIGAYENVTQ